jgi:hypothetical protein
MVVDDPTAPGDPTHNDSTKSIPVIGARSASQFMDLLFTETLLATTFVCGK